MKGRRLFRFGMIIVFIGSVTSFCIFLYREFADKDHIAPVIECQEDVIWGSIKDEKESFLQGIRAEDNVDGDITENVFIEKIEKKEQAEENVFDITYVVFDSSNNVGKKTRTLIYHDYHPPRFHFSAPLRAATTEQIDLLSAVTVEDCIDGDISSFVKVLGDDILGEEIEAGIYNCVLEVTNSLGDTASLPVNVEFYEDTYAERMFRPVIYLKEYIVYLDKGEAFEPYDYIDYVEDRGVKQIDDGPMVSYEEDGEEKMVTEAAAQEKPGDWINISQIICNSNVDTDTPGNYTVVFSYESEDTKYSGSTEMIVVKGDSKVASEWRE